MNRTAFFTVPIVIILAVLFFVLQLIVVPIMAKNRGKDAGVWFLLTVVWICLNSGLAIMMLSFEFIFGIPLTFTYGDAPARQVVLIFLVFLVIALCLPTIVLLFSKRINKQADLERRVRMVRARSRMRRIT